MEGNVSFQSKDTSACDIYSIIIHVFILILLYYIIIFQMKLYFGSHRAKKEFDLIKNRMLIVRSKLSCPKLHWYVDLTW